ncbi:5-methyltetrahydropteroyltriglutamate--homocysteine S-methyltransferase [Jeotgalibacillus soli]|uniref:5-methyltetrahydropteroyltriglutamate--homocysteine methyltransferase n=1 Tax=Jeotgalibacillus soli TaxID=889306 RepID=A0A0C2VRW9_9BACL|nr:5-methyltetrahydropteroyltriglutamate--homocysteine S-methyltransferase [Jeotgalibacillus soli]KIL47191.1 5-methyltetrahydropteroyltriglutamate--homocysteine methyltransferase [Jeotgalibacillus soli]
MNTLKTSLLGYPRIGENREWKKALEAHWAKKISEEELLQQTEEIRLKHLQKQKDKGIDLIPVGDFTLYDHVLDTAVMFGLIPDRIQASGAKTSLETYFAMARGNKEAAASEMTKWFNTNYHYIVPEYSKGKMSLNENKPLQAYREAKDKLGIEGKPVIVGPYTFIKLAKGYEDKELPQFILELLPLYEQLLKELEQDGVKWVQIDEPILVTSITHDEMKTVEFIYKKLNEAAPDLSIMLQTYFDAVEWYEEVMKLPVQGIGLDFVHGGEKTLASLKAYGFPKDKVLAAGVIDGRNIWRADLKKKYDLIQTITAIVPNERLLVQPSSSLLHVPVNVRSESHLDSTVQSALAFADEKIEELVQLAESVNIGDQGKHLFAANETAIRTLAKSEARNRSAVREAVASITEKEAQRTSDFDVRNEKQQSKWDLPLLPTTTIGSFPQTKEVRKARLSYKKGEWSAEKYEGFIEAEIERWIKLQEELGLDVLVHGEFERTDMVEYFGEKLNGFAFTKNGWVQSYGSRCVKPPLIYGDVEFVEPMTVKESLFAQSLTDKPVKGMLTGPVTILNWSFVRDDIPRSEVTYQLALALRKEVEALEESGITMIQVDEPALREGLPLKKEAWDQYLNWAVASFKITTSSVEDTTQIHTHMCYCEFHDFIDPIRDLDADVISIETSRSHGELVSSFEDHAYHNDIGLGVYDIHSPRVPDVEEMVQMIQRGLSVLGPKQFWINPDCGLKTRGESETIDSLKNMVAATAKVRQSLAQKQV